MSDEAIGTITVEGREVPLYEIRRFTAGEPPVEHVDVRTSEGYRRFVGVRIEHVAFGPDGTAEARLTRMEHRPS